MFILCKVYLLMNKWGGGVGRWYSNTDIYIYSAALTCDTHNIELYSIRGVESGRPSRGGEPPPPHMKSGMANV